MPMRIACLPISEMVAVTLGSVARVQCVISQHLHSRRPYRSSEANQVSITRVTSAPGLLGQALETGCNAPRRAEIAPAALRNPQYGQVRLCALQDMSREV